MPLAILQSGIRRGEGSGEGNLKGIILLRFPSPAFASTSKTLWILLNLWCIFALIMNTNTSLAPDFTLCTYTYNDGRLADELLRAVAAWPVRPREIIVVDDGSAEPYAPGPEAAAAPGVEVKVIRLPVNAGPGVCKAAGLSAARGEYILSLDCDIRPQAPWLRAAFEVAGQEGVGLVGGAVVSDAGEDAVSRYLREVDHHLRPEGETDFVSGAAWLLPRAVWEAVGGFGGYTARTHEDHHFCSRVRAAGYKVMACTAADLRQVRVLSRADMLLRFRAWLESSLREQSAPYETIQVSAFQVCKESLRRLEYLLRTFEGDVRMIYLETLLCLYTLQYMCAFKDNEPSRGAAEALRRAVSGLLDARPQTLGLMSRDLGWSDPANPAAGQGEAASGAPFEQQIANWEHFWRMMFEPLQGLFDSSLGRKLEDQGVAAVLDEDKNVKTDYSFYKDLRN